MLRALLSVFLVSLLAPGCGEFKKSGATGSSGEVTIFFNTAPDGLARTALDGVFDYDIDVVSLERAYLLDPVPFDRFGIHRQVKNQIFLVDLSRDDELARRVPAFLGDRGRELFRTGEPFRLLVHDLWADGQTTLFVVGRSERELVDLLSGDVEGLRRQFEESVVEGLTRTMFSLGETPQLTRQTAREFGWRLRFPGGFYAAADAEGRVVKFSAENPVRLVTVHWLDEDLPLDPGAWRPHMDRILARYNDGDFVYDPATRAVVTEFQGEPAVRWEGVWQNEKYTIGGPFRAFAFRRDGRSWILLGQVYNPGNDKVPALRQAEAILHTFRIVS
jgi:hypothetical protein